MMMLWLAGFLVGFSLGCLFMCAIVRWGVSDNEEE